MKNRFNRKLTGFSLIELLIVVLVVGILAAVALPQYEKSVEKSRLMKALSLFKSFQESIQMYQMTTGKKPVSLEDLDVVFPSKKYPFPSKFSLAVVYGSSVEDYVSIDENTALVLSVTDTRWPKNFYLIRYSPKFGSYMFFPDVFIQSNTGKIICAESKNNQQTPCQSIFGGEFFPHLYAANEKFYYM